MPDRNTWFEDHGHPYTAVWRDPFPAHAASASLLYLRDYERAFLFGSSYFLCNTICRIHLLEIMNLLPQKSCFEPHLDFFRVQKLRYGFKDITSFWGRSYLITISLEGLDIFPDHCPGNP